MKLDNLNIKRHDNSEVEITAEVPAEAFASYRTKAIASLGKDVELPGFRKGKVPEKMLASRFGEGMILEEMSELAIRDAYPSLLVENKIDAIGAPAVTVTKVGVGSVLGFKVVVPVMPEIKLPDYKKLAAKAYAEKTDTTVTDKEFDDAITDLLKHRTGHTHPPAKEKDQADEKDVPTEETPKDAPLPELTDEYIKTLGQFENVDDFKKKYREGMVREKEQRDSDKKRMNALEAIMKEMTVGMPNILIEGELDRMMAEFENTVAQAGGTLEDYWKQTGKNMADARMEWRSDAEKRVKAQLTLGAIAREEKLEPDPQDVKIRVEYMQTMYPTADPERIRGYVEMLLGNEVVFKFLSGEKGKKDESEPTKKD